jgi:hypothetical protein
MYFGEFDSVSLASIIVVYTMLDYASIISFEAPGDKYEALAENLAIFTTIAEDTIAIAITCVWRGQQYLVGEHNHRIYDARLYQSNSYLSYGMSTTSVSTISIATIRDTNPQSPGQVPVTFELCMMITLLHW